jgi:hypothetical protein
MTRRSMRSRIKWLFNNVPLRPPSVSTVSAGVTPALTRTFSSNTAPEDSDVSPVNTSRNSFISPLILSPTDSIEPESYTGWSSPKQEIPEEKQAAWKTACSSPPIQKRLKRGVLAVQGAGILTVNGAYICTGMSDSVGIYAKEGLWKDCRVTFTILRCQHFDLSRRWYISIVSEDNPPGTKHDTDLYTALAATSQCTLDEYPPQYGWRIVSGSGLEGSPPLCMWIPNTFHNTPPAQKQHVEEDGRGCKNKNWTPMKCVVCMERAVTHVFVPCGHASVCGICANACMHYRSKDKKKKNKDAPCCPICRCKVESVIRIYGTIIDDEVLQTPAHTVTKRPMDQDDSSYVDPFTLD